MNKYNNIEIHPPLSSSTEEQRYLLSCGGQYYEASRPIVDLVEELQRHATEDAAIAAYVERRGGKYTPEQVRQIIDNLLGVPNLRQRSREWLGYVWKRLRGRTSPKPYLLTVRRAERYGLLVYSVVVNVFMGYYFLWVIPKFLFDFVKSFPDEVESLIIYLSNGVTPPFALLRNIGSQLLFLALIAFMAVNLVRPWVRKKRSSKSTRNT